MNKAFLKIRSDILRLMQEGKKTIEFRKLNKDFIQVGYRVTLYPYNVPDVPVQAIITDKQYILPGNAVMLAEDKETKDFITKNYSKELMLVMFSFKILPTTKGRL